MTRTVTSSVCVEVTLLVRETLTPTLVSTGSYATVNYSVSASSSPAVSGLLTLTMEETTPEPGTLLLVALSMGVLALRRRG